MSINTGTESTSSKKTRAINIWPFNRENNWLRADRRRNFLKKLSRENITIDKGQIEQMIDRDLLITVGTVSLSVVGSFGFPMIRLLSVPGILYGFIPIFRKAYTKIKQREPDLSIYYATLQALELYAGLFVPTALGNLWFQISHKMMVIAQERYRQNLESLFDDLPTAVYVLIDGVEVERPLDTLVAGDVIVLKAGEIIPIDGIVKEGFATVDQQALTGESQPAEKSSGDVIYASTVVLSGQIQVALELAGDETRMAQIGEIVESTMALKDTKQAQAEAFTNRTVLPVIGLSGLAYPFIGFHGAQAILDAHPQYRIIISTPLSTINFLNQIAEQAILVKDGRTFELLNQVDTIVFDKTGTLTLDQPAISQIHLLGDNTKYQPEQILAYAAAAEQRQSHPIARAILEEMAERAVEIPDVDDAQYQIGYGLTVRLLDSGELIRVGSSRFMEQESIVLSAAAEGVIDQAKVQGSSMVLVAVDDQVIGGIELQARLRPEAEDVVQWLRGQGKEIYLISGDHAQPTAALAKQLDIQHYFAETLPEEKGQLIEQLQAQGKRVCFVGDGINDTIAMKKSYVSISLRGATTAATDTAQVVLMNANLQQIGTLFDTAKQHQRNMRTTGGTILTGATISIVSALFFGTGILFTATVNTATFPISLASAMLPTLKNSFHPDQDSK